MAISYTIRQDTIIISGTTWQDKELHTELKEHGFRWKPGSLTWEAEFTEERRDFADRVSFTVPIALSKEEILRRRGFSSEEIADLSSISEDEWRITTISQDEVINTDPTDINALSKMYGKLFARDSIDSGITSTATNESFGEFANIENIYIPKASTLEPYIARFVRAANNVGIRSTMSCDGWHIERGAFSEPGIMKLWLKEIYSVLWMSLITEYIFGERWVLKKKYDDIKWENMWEPQNYFKEYTNIGERVCNMEYRYGIKNIEAAFEKINSYAEFLEIHKEELLRIRSKWIEGISNSKNSGEAYKHFVAFRNKTHAYIAEDLRALQLKF